VRDGTGPLDRNAAPDVRVAYNGGTVEVWDADDFITWQELRWTRVRVLRYRHVRRGGRIFGAYGLTNLPARRVGSRALFRMAKSRWAARILSTPAAQRPVRTSPFTAPCASTDSITPIL